ncbi:MAG: hypothetical protein B7Z57_13670 [Acidiphilium sp. 37-60-79]|nr:MAG: hypothetical protein B7Z57_13670 [Acidiphilium sp. 37-60-79]
MLLNLKTFKLIHDKLIEFTLKNLHIGLDQEILREFVGTDYLLLPDTYNWKPYWGINQDASIIHWHGPKPETINNLLNNSIEKTNGIWQDLFEKDKNSYAYYLEYYKKLIKNYKKSERNIQKIPRINLVKGKFATQSSVSEWAAHTTPEADAVGALDGVIDGQQGFHTDIEESPWWMVDLGDIFGISEIRIFNRMDIPGVAERASRLAIEIGLEQDNFVEVYRREEQEPFGGVDGHPLVFKPTIPIPGRYARIRLLNRNYLHLDQVEVYGDHLPYGEKYRPGASSPFEGVVDQIKNGILTGWARQISCPEPAHLILFVDHKRVSCFDANIWRPDLHAAGIGTGQHGFSVDIAEFLERPQSIVEVFVESRTLALQNSGMTIASLSIL